MKSIFRREFLKYTAAGASFVALNHCLGGLSASTETDGSPYVNRNNGKRIKGIATTCAGCGAGCGVIAYVRDGVLMKLKGNPAHPINKGRLCLVGEAGVYALADPERLTAPVKRVGKRGQGHWKEISWKEAMSLVAENIKASRRKLVIESRGGFTDDATREFMGRMGGGSLVSHAHVVSANRETAMMDTFGVPYDIPDITNTGYILNFGANPFASDPMGVHTVNAIASLRASNSTVRLVTLDPRLSETAGRSDEWIPITPGTDGMVALAMANVIMSGGLYDASFIESRTNVSVAELKRHLASYTPQAAARISGVRAEDIRRIAAEYARSPRAVVLTGGGVSSHGHGMENERAIKLLAVITGKVDRAGCNNMPRKAAPVKSDMAPEQLYSMLVEGSGDIGVYMVHGCDPAYSSPSPDRVAKALADSSRLPFIVCMDTHITDTGVYADLILPTTTYLEEYAVESAPGPCCDSLVRYRRPVVSPAGGSKPYIGILAETALAAGMDLGFRSDGGYVAMKLMDTPELSGPRDIAKLEKDGFFAVRRQFSGGAARFAGKYPTPSGRIELRTGKGPGLPSSSSPDNSGNWKQGELMLVRYNPVGYREGFTENNMLLKELNNMNFAFINAGLGRALGFKNRDEAIISSPAGRLQVRVMLSPGINENTVAIAAGSGHKGHGNIEKGEKFSSSDPFTNAIWWGHNGSGVNPNTVIGLDTSMPSGQAGLSLTKVSLQKA